MTATAFRLRKLGSPLGVAPHMTDHATVRDDREGRRFVLEQDDGTGELTYEVEDGRLILLHTEVGDALRGHGAGGDLVRAAVKRASDEALTIVPWCPYARRWLREHPDEVGAVTVDFRTPPPGS